jgi:hypothetical protein
MVNETGKTTYSSIIHIQSKPVREDVIVNSVFKDRIDIQVSNNREEEAAVHLFNSSGKLVKYQEIKLNKGKNFTSIDNLDTLAPGVYVLVIRNGNQDTTKKIIKL